MLIVRGRQVGAMDDKLLEKLASTGVNTFSMNSGLTTEDFGWGSKTFHKMVRPGKAGYGSRGQGTLHQ